jgi:DNA-binding GntR family transcriptional regulator
MVEAAKQRDVDRVARIDRLFHERLWNLTEHDLLIDLASQLRGKINGFLRATTLALAQDELERHAASHHELLDVIASGDADAAQQEMVAHIEIAADRIRHSLAQELVTQGD